MGHDLITGLFYLYSDKGCAMTRLATVLVRQKKEIRDVIQGTVMSLGTCNILVLALVVKRFLEQPSAATHALRLYFQCGNQCIAFDVKNNTEDIADLFDRIKGCTEMRVTNVNVEVLHKRPPHPPNTDAIYSYCSRIHQMTATQVHSTLRNLHAGHLISYGRSFANCFENLFAIE